ncbi:MAG: MBL fold metallo-hydrolase, partial [Thermoanaerobaculia bacterium]
MPAMTAPKSGVKVRMYRQGHGDCFLLAFPRRGGGKPVYMMIDCGYKPGSQKTLKVKKIADVAKHIGEATDKFIDVVVITHEHQDHVNGLSHFKDFTFGQAWFAWTEDPEDDIANALRKKHKDQLLGLLGAREQMTALAMDDSSA